MKLNGREVKFKRTIWATIAVAAMCPDKDPMHIDEVLKENFSDGNLAAAQFVCILSEGYERQKAFEASQTGEDYEELPLTMDEIMNLDDFEIFQELFLEAANAWKNDSKPTVETQPAPGKKKSSRKQSS